MRVGLVLSVLLAVSVAAGTQGGTDGADGLSLQGSTPDVVPGTGGAKNVCAAVSSAVIVILWVYCLAMLFFSLFKVLCDSSAGVSCHIATKEL